MVNSTTDSETVHAGSVGRPPPSWTASLAWRERTTEAFEASPGAGSCGEADPSVAHPPSPDWLGERYQWLEVIGRGGAGDVHLCWDHKLQQRAAVKVLRRDMVDLSRFESVIQHEMAATARLSHPAIAAPFDAGLTRDGRNRPFTVSRYYDGPTLAEVLRAVHDGRSRLSVVDLLGMLVPLMGAVAYAHARGVLHRDIKPSNIILVQESLVLLDWGMAHVMGGGGGLRLGGSVMNMSPEQARGQDLDWDPRSDVFSFGALLFQVVSGRDPWDGTQAEVLAHLRSNPEPPRCPTIRPTGLQAILTGAMAARREARTDSVASLSEQLSAWLKQQADWRRVEAQMSAAQLRLARAGRLRRDAERIRTTLDGRTGSGPPAEIEARFEAEDRQRDLLLKAEMAEEEAESALLAARVMAPGSRRVQELLEAAWMARHERFERHGDSVGAARLRVRLRTSPRPEVAAYLSGDGRLSVRFPGASRIRLRGFVSQARTMSLGPVLAESTDHFSSQPVPMGSHIVEVESPSGPPFVWPVWIGRGEVKGDPEPLWCPVPPPYAVGPDEVFIPAGRAVFGGGAAAGAATRRRRVERVEAHVVRRLPVTHREFCAWLNQLVDRGEPALAERYAPRVKGRQAGTGNAVYERDGLRFVVGRDADGDAVDPDWPVYAVTFAAALAFLRGLRSPEGQPGYRLPVEREWVRFARGADGRDLPWWPSEDGWVPGRAGTRDRSTGRPMPVPVGSHPLDCSVFGVSDLAGTICEMTSSWLDGPAADLLLPEHDVPEGAQCVVRGGCWASGVSSALLSYRGGSLVGATSPFVGFRAVRSLRWDDSARQ